MLCTLAILTKSVASPRTLKCLTSRLRAAIAMNLLAAVLITVSSAHAALVTPSAGPNGSITPTAPQSVETGDRGVFTVSANSGYTASVAGSCGGTLIGTTYTTNPVSDVNCTVVASFAPLVVTYAVQSSQLGGNGSVTPLSTQSVNAGSVAIFSVAPSAGFAVIVSGTCGGALVNNSYTTNPISADCTVVFNFVAIPGAGVSIATLSPGSLLALVLLLAGLAITTARRMLRY
jgi:hypothetical protein